MLTTRLGLLAALLIAGLWTYPLAAATPVDQMSPGLRDAYAKGIQEELINRGFYRGPVDGIVGGGTKRAIRSYQRSVGLPVDGVATDDLLNHLRFVDPQARPEPAATEATLTEPTQLMPNSAPASVYEIQRALRDRGYDPGAADGQMDAQTRNAIRAYQRDKSLTPDGEPTVALLDHIRASGESIIWNDPPAAETQPAPQPTTTTGSNQTSDPETVRQVQ